MKEIRKFKYDGKFTDLEKEYIDSTIKKYLEENDIEEDALFQGKVNFVVSVTNKEYIINKTKIL